MASKRSTIQSKLASAMLKKAQKADGDTITLSHQGATAASLTATIGAATVNPVDSYGNAIDGEMREFEIPLQTNFAGALSPGDIIAWNSLSYVVMGHSVDKWGAVYVARAIYSRANRVKG